MKGHTSAADGPPDRRGILAFLQQVAGQSSHGGRADTRATLRTFCVHPLLCVLALLAVPAQAQEPPPVAARAADVVAVLAQDRPAEEVFAASFLAAVPEAQLRALAASMNGQFGLLLRVEAVTPGAVPGSAEVTFRFERAIGRGVMQLEPAAPFRVTGLRINAFDVMDDSAAKIAADLAALPGEAGVLLRRLGTPQPAFAHQADRQFAIGSTMKLYVLSALAHEVQAGKRKWSDVVPLGAPSLSSGQMQDWPARAPVTLHTLATMMISISDNTATDTLITLLGHEAVEAEVRASGHARPELNTPFLTTRQSFLLKGGDSGALYTYAHAGEMDRRDMLADLAGAELDRDRIMAAFAGGPRGIDVEWFASGQDIAAVLQRIRALPDRTALDVLAVNPSLGNAEQDWAYAGYKGGSEPGVLNLSWLLQDKAGDWYVLAMSWNNPQAAVDQQQFALIAQRVLALARRP